MHAYAKRMHVTSPSVVADTSTFHLNVVLFVLTTLISLLCWSSRVSRSAAALASVTEAVEYSPVINVHVVVAEAVEYSPVISVHVVVTEAVEYSPVISVHVVVTEAVEFSPVISVHVVVTEAV